MLLPVVLVHPNKRLQGLDMFGIGNVGASVQIRLVAYAAVSCFISALTVLLAAHEYRVLATTRRAYLREQQRRGLPYTRTALVTNLPNEFRGHSTMREIGLASGTAIETVWFVEETPKPIKELFKKRRQS